MAEPVSIPRQRQVETYYRNLREKQVSARMKLHQKYFDNVILKQATQEAERNHERFMQHLYAHFKRQDYIYQQKAQDIHTEAHLKSSL